MRCRLILSISDHPIQLGIRKEGGYPERDGGGEEGQVWANSMKLDGGRSMICVVCLIKSQ